MSWLLVLQSALFLPWAGMMFYTLFAVRRIAADKTGSINPGVGATLSAWRVRFTDPQTRPRAMLLVWLTVALVITILANSLLMERAV